MLNSIAPRVFISYSHDSEPHKARVLSLAEKLRSDGIDVWIDRYDPSPSKGWIKTMDDKISSADFVLVVCSKSYKKRFERKEDPGIGRGATWEGGIIERELYKNSLENLRFIPIVFDEYSDLKVPGVFQDYTCYILTKEYTDLLRHLTNQPEIVPGELGPIPSLPSSRSQKILAETAQPYLPRIWNVPYNRNRNFTGRKELLKSIYENFLNSKEILTPQVIVGLGGIGKSQTVLEYCYLQKNNYNIIWWISCEDKLNISTTFINLAGKLNLPESEIEGFEAKKQAVRNYLSSNDSYLIVFDNSSSQEEINEFIPQGTGGHILVTSRNPNWNEFGIIHSVSEWSRSETINFLIQKTNINDYTSASKLANLIGDLPLAASQASAYIVEYLLSSSYHEYIELFIKKRNELWEDERNPLDYNQTVETTWSISIDQISKKNPSSLNVLMFCSLLSSEQIPLELFDFLFEYIFKQEIDTLQKKIILKKAFYVLRSHSLISQNSDSISVHRLVQLVCHDQLKKQGTEETYLEILIEKFKKYWPKPGHENWHHIERLFPHVKRVLTHSKDFIFNPLLMHRLNYLLGIYCLERSFFSESAVYFTSSIEHIHTAEKSFAHIRNEESLKFLAAETLLKTARANESLGNYENAENNLKKAISYCKEIIEMDGEAPLQQALFQLYSLYGITGRFSEVQNFSRDINVWIYDNKFSSVFESLDIDISKDQYLAYVNDPTKEKFSTKKDILIKIAQEYEDKFQDALTGIATVIQLESNEAKEYLTNNFDLIEKHLIDTSKISHLAGRLDIVEQYYAVYVLLCQKTFGNDDYKTIDAIKKFADLHNEKGNFDNAIKSYILCYQGLIRLEKYDESIDIALAIGHSFVNLNQLKTGLAWFRFATINHKRVYKERVADFISILKPLAETHEKLENYCKAKSTYVYIKDLTQSIFGRNHSRTFLEIENLARFLESSKKYKQAATFFLEVLSIKQDIFGTESPNLIKTYSDLGSLYIELDYYNEAKEYLLKGSSICKNQDNNIDMYCLHNYILLALLHQNLGNNEKSLQYYRSSILPFIEQNYGDDSKEYSDILCKYAEQLLAIDNTQEAKFIYKKALSISEKVLGSNHPNTMEIKKKISSNGIAE